MNQQPPENLFAQIASGVDEDAAADLVANRNFRAIVELAYRAGWRDHEQLLIDRLSDVAKAVLPHRWPPEVYP